MIIAKQILVYAKSFLNILCTSTASSKTIIKNLTEYAVHITKIPI